MVSRKLADSMRMLGRSALRRDIARPRLARCASTSTGNRSTFQHAKAPLAILLTVGGLGAGAAWMDSAKPAGKSSELEKKSSITVYDVPLGKKFPKSVPCFVEVSAKSRNKYEWDNELGFLRLDRVLHSAVFYPHNYGFIPQTLCGDGDPLDVLIIGGGEMLPGSWIDARPVGYMIMEDEKGQDEKVLAVAQKDPRYDEVKTLDDIPQHLLNEISHFFETYKALERKKWAKVGGWKSTEETYKLLQQTHQNYLKAKEMYNEIQYSKN